MNSELTLGLSSIGDLLINNMISKTDTKDPIDNIRLRIPNYQRPYK